MPDGPGGMVDAGIDPAVGMEPPTLVGETFDGSSVEIDPSDGRAKVVLFIAHWCPHCQNEVPQIQEWINDGKQPEGVDIYAVSTAVDPDAVNYPPSKWIVSESFDPSVLLDDEASGPQAPGSAALSYGVTGWPAFVFINTDGNVVQRGSGEIPIEEFDAAVNNLTA